MEGCDIVVGAAAIITLKETILHVGGGLAGTLFVCTLIHAFLTGR